MDEAHTTVGFAETAHTDQLSSQVASIKDLVKGNRGAETPLLMGTGTAASLSDSWTWRTTSVVAVSGSLFKKLAKGPHPG